MSLRVAVFDVLGTVLNERGGFRAAAASAGSAGGAVDAFGDRWLAEVDAGTAAVASGSSPWRPWDRIVQDALAHVAPGLDDPRPRLVGHRLVPWADSQPGVAEIRLGRPVVALSNAGVLPMVESFRSAGLEWDAVLSGEMVRAAKPDARVYRFLIETLQTDPREMVMVAAHPWDLRAAASHGLRTAFIRRPEEGLPDEHDRFDWTATDLIDLAGRLRGN